MTSPAAIREQLEVLIEENDVEGISALLARAHPADVAAMYARLSPGLREEALELLTPQDLSEVFLHMTAAEQDRFARGLPAHVLAKILDRCPPNVATDVLQRLSMGTRNAVLTRMATAPQVTPLLAYPEESAGGVMTTRYLAVNPEMTAEQALRLFRLRQPKDHEIRYLYVVDEANKLLGVVSLRSILMANPVMRLRDRMVTDIKSVTPTTGREEAARMLRTYHLQAVPVVDEQGILNGVIGVDDALEVLVAEATADIHQMAGVGIKEHVTSPVWESAARRVPWLSFNMVWAFAGAAIISLFEGTIQQVAAVAVFMPLIAGQAGNAGIQTATIMVRSMALGELDHISIFTILRKEWGVGLIKAVLFGGILAIVAYFLKHNMTLAWIAGVALFLNIMVASTAGVVLPLTLRRFGMDPATVAGVFDTMLTDFMGFVIYLGLCTIFITALVATN